IARERRDQRPRPVRVVAQRVDYERGQDVHRADVDREQYPVASNVPQHVVLSRNSGHTSMRVRPKAISKPSWLGDGDWELSGMRISENGSVPGPLTPPCAEQQQLKPTSRANAREASVMFAALP